MKNEAGSPVWHLARNAGDVGAYNYVHSFAGGNPVGQASFATRTMESIGHHSGCKNGN
jgi:hypothetical protein